MFINNVRGQIARKAARTLAIITTTAMVSTSITSCNDLVVAAGCNVSGPLIQGIALALKLDPGAAPASIILDLVGAEVTDACKALFADDTAPTTTEGFLKGDPHVPDQFRLPGQAQLCLAGIGQFGSVAAGTTVTSCQFSKNVRTTFLDSGSHTGSLDAYSPVVPGWFTMDCDGVYPIICTGGRNAVVYIY